MDIGTFLWGSLATGLLALAFAWWKALWIGRQDPGTERMREIGGSIRDGAMAFLKREYTVIAVAVVLVEFLPQRDMVLAVHALDADGIRTRPLPFGFGPEDLDLRVRIEVHGRRPRR